MASFRGRARPARPSFEAAISGATASGGSNSPTRRGRSSTARGAGARSLSPDITSPIASAAALMPPPRAPRGRIVHEKSTPSSSSGSRSGIEPVPAHFARIASSMPTYSSSSDDSDDEDDDEDSDDDPAPKRKGKEAGSSRPRKGKKGTGEKSRQKEAEAAQVAPTQGGVRAAVTLTNKEMVHNSLLYFLLMQHKKLPIKRSDIIKHAMNDQGKVFPEVMKELGTVFDDVLGMKVHGLEASTKTGQFSSYMLTSNYNLSVSDIVTERNSDVDYKRSILFIVLSIIFMLNRSIEEDTIWKIITELQLHEPTDPVEEEEIDGDDDCNGINTQINYCTKREDLARFLKKEYVSTMYLRAETEQNITRYSWGKRAEKEFSKYAILKFVCKYFPGKKPCDFMDQYNIVQEQEREAVEKDVAIDERTSADMEKDHETLADALAQSESRGSGKRGDSRGSPNLDGRRRGRIVPMNEAETETEDTSSRRGGRIQGRVVRGSSSTPTSAAATGHSTDTSGSPDRRSTGVRKRRAIIESDDDSEADQSTRTATTATAKADATALNGAMSKGRATRTSAKSS